MSVIRLREHTYDHVRSHLFSAPGEHFGFLLAESVEAPDGPILLVTDFHEIEDAQVTLSNSGWEVSTEALLEGINRAVRTNAVLIEVHNHPGGWSEFSSVDREGFQEFVPYVLDSLPGRPYAATVWTEDGIYGEYFLHDGAQHTIRSITVVGERFLQLAAGPPNVKSSRRFSRQESWFTREGQRRLGHLRVAVVGLGGTGSQVAQNLAYLGIRDFVLIDDDVAEDTNMNRLVTATVADLETPKAILARRLIRNVAPEARVLAVPKKLQSEEALAALKAADLAFGCVDNDGARLVLNELCLAYVIPLIDLGVGIDAPGGSVEEAGGRVAMVTPGGPCLYCMREIDVGEAQYFLKDPAERRRDRDLGYIKGVDERAPSVVSLNGVVAACAVNELAIWMSGIRPPHPLTVLDLVGRARTTPSQWLTPQRVDARDGCVQCSIGGYGDRARIERYAQARSTSEDMDPQPKAS